MQISINTERNTDWFNVLCSAEIGCGGGSQNVASLRRNGVALGTLEEWVLLVVGVERVHVGLSAEISGRRFMPDKQGCILASVISARSRSV